MPEAHEHLLDETEVSLPVPEIWFGVWVDNEATHHLPAPQQRVTRHSTLLPASRNSGFNAFDLLTRQEHGKPTFSPEWKASQIVITNSFDHPHFEIDGHLFKLKLSAEMQIHDEIASAMWDMLEKQDKRLAAKLASGFSDIVDPVPSAFQIRFGGAKGMASVDPSLPGRRVNIRQSMIKFDTKNSSVIEVAHYSSVTRDAYSNRQIILILEDLRVPKQVFMELQRNAVRELASMWGDKTKLIELAGKDAAFGNYARLRENMQLSEWLTNEVVPGGWHVLGVLDETGTLKEGQVFVQIRSPHETKVLTGPHIIYRSPVIHPGDVQAVDFAKSGKPASMAHAPKPRGRPDFMYRPNDPIKEGFYKSSRAMGLMYRDEELNSMIDRTYSEGQKERMLSDADRLWRRMKTRAGDWESYLEDATRYQFTFENEMERIANYTRPTQFKTTQFTMTPKTTTKGSARSFRNRCRDVMSKTLMHVAERMAPRPPLCDQAVLEDADNARSTMPVKAPALDADDAALDAADKLDENVPTKDNRVVASENAFLSLMSDENDRSKILEKMSLVTDKNGDLLARERVLLTLANDHKKNSEKSEIQLYRHVLKAVTKGCIEYKTHPADVGITIDGQKMELSPLYRSKGPSTKRLAPKFIHNSVISVRVWSSAERDFCRINIGASVWDDTPLFAVSHTWRNAISSDGIPVQGYTDAIMKAVRMTATEHLKDSKQKDYYVWLDYFSTDQHSLFEVREATMKMAWVYSAAACTVVILDTTLSVSDKDFWSNRVWVMQEEALSSELVFFNRNGQKCNIEKENDGGDKLLKYDGLVGDNLKNNIQKSPEGELAGLLVGSVIAKDVWGAKRDFSDFWPDMLKRYGGFSCDKVYASQYCSKLKTYLDIRYDLNISQTLVLYIQKLIEAKDYSVTTICMTPRAPGWGCVRVFPDDAKFFVATGRGDESTYLEYRVDKPLGFIGGHGFPNELPDISSQIHLDPAMGLVVDGVVVLVILDPNDTDALSQALAAALKKNKKFSGKYGDGDALVSKLFGCYWNMVERQFTDFWKSSLGKRYKTGNLLEELETKDVMRDDTFLSSVPVDKSRNFLTWLEGRQQQFKFEKELGAILRKISKENDANELLRVIAKIARAFHMDRLRVPEEQLPTAVKTFKRRNYELILSSNGLCGASAQHETTETTQTATVESIVNDLSLYRFNNACINTRSAEQLYDFGNDVPPIVRKMFLGWDQDGIFDRDALRLMRERAELYRDVTEAFQHNRKERLSTGVRGLGRRILIETVRFRKNDFDAEQMHEEKGMSSTSSDGKFALTLTEEHPLPIPVHTHEHIKKMENMIPIVEFSGSSQLQFDTDVGWNIVRGVCSEKSDG
ncbi:Protein rrf1 [Chytriomyces hyalinus]|nr:Protein rrf1 [Chytriomyces hyalinus]